jgi:hypothetical protein
MNSQIPGWAEAPPPPRPPSDTVPFVGPVLFFNFLLNMLLLIYLVIFWVRARAGAFNVGFPTGRDSATFWDKGTEVS